VVDTTKERVHREEIVQQMMEVISKLEDSKVKSDEKWSIRVENPYISETKYQVSLAE
jgi:hypothetical protein